MTSPPTSPQLSHPARPMSAMIRPVRSHSRLSMSSRPGGSSRASDEDSKTSVKVAVRVRPPLNPTDPGYDLIPQRFQRSMVTVTSPTSLAVDSPQGRKIFVFDRVFSENVGQDGVWEYLQESVNAFIQGYNVSILAYGQSGAGKSYTMGTADPGDHSDPSSAGIISRAAACLFEKLGATTQPNNRSSVSGLRTPTRYSNPISVSQKNDHRSWTMKATYVEIYNEHLRDLLIPGDIRPEDRAQVSIREDTKGRILLTGLHQVTINSVEDLMSALHFGSSIRQTDATAINAQSSRSHAVFSLNLIQKKPKPLSKEEKRLSMPLDMMSGDAGFITVDSKLHFVDLAGSERLKNTQAQGERAREGISINAGLAALGKVISQLSSRQAGSHVSYRDSKLTRLLQDSLGGSAITYMIACVTPAEFHLSETLNTVQYAQRARAIQSKPRIQQVSEDGDTKALIESLRAEISFLREQLRNSNTSDSSERLRKTSQDRSERNIEKEMELQNQLLDLQENYSALSQRHAKLISEIARARDTEDSSTTASEYVDTAVERLKRSNSFAEAVEQVVLEYEKTIQSLESSLSSTRSSLSTTESSLLEKETKLAYIETVNQQLQARVQKMMDRESSTESYLRELERKLDGHTSGEEKNASIIAELRKEISRARENETGCEDYISTLEERLAEADQEHELMQREIARLEHVIERQRNLGKLDNLLAEFNTADLERKTVNEDQKQSILQNESEKRHNAPKPAINGHLKIKQNGREKGSQVSEVPVKINGEKRVSFEDNTKKPAEVSIANSSSLDATDYPPQSPAQAQFVNDKLENVQQELLELRVEHETTVSEFEQLSLNYEASLRDMARLQDQLDELKHAKKCETPPTTSPPPSPSPMRPTSFLAGARVSELKGTEGQGQSSFSRSLSSELSSASELDIPGNETAQIRQELETLRALQQEHQEREEVLAAQLKSVKQETKVKQEKINALERERDRIREEHQDALEFVEELKGVAKGRNSGHMSPSTASNLLRRKSNQSLTILDRAHRSFNSLRKIASPYLESNPDAMESFEMNLDEIMHELNLRTDRIQDLENEIAGLRKELESKSTMINGLTRERTSKTSSPMDISVIAIMERRIEEAEAEAISLRRQLSERESEYLKQITDLQEQLVASMNEVKGHVNSLMDVKTLLSENMNLTEKQSLRITQLEDELHECQIKEKAAVEGKEALLKTIAELEQTLTEAEALRLETIANASTELKRAMAESEEGRAQQHDLISSLKKLIEDDKATIASQMSRIQELEQELSMLKSQINTKVAETTAASEASESQVRQHRETIADIRTTVEEKLLYITRQEERISELEALHKTVIEEVEAAKKSETAAVAALNEKEKQLEELAISAAESREEALAAAQATYEEALKVAKATYQGDFAATVVENEKALTSARSELRECQKTIEDQRKRLEELESSLMEAHSLLEILEGDKKAAQGAVSIQTALEEELAENKKMIAGHVATIKELHDLHNNTQTELEKLSKKEAKHLRVIEELEQQLTFTFDENQETAKKLATVTAELEQLRQERQTLKDDATKKTNEVRQMTEKMTEELNLLKNQLVEARNELSNVNRAQRSNSISNNKDLRKSTSTTSLPSPPPVIPLPPVPGANGTGTGSVGTSSSPPGTAVSPSHSMSRRPSKDYFTTHMDDQEARIKTLEKKLQSEKALTQTLEEALAECEKTMKRMTEDRDSLQLKASQVQQELDRARNESQSTRYSLQAVEDERLARIKAEQAKAQLEERMQALAKKNKRSFACF